jgi:hypothetical protein
VDSLSIAGTLFIYTGLGVVKFFPGDPNLIADIVPCDLVANLLLAAVVHFGSDPSRLQKAQDIPVVHAATSSANPVKYVRQMVVINLCVTSVVNSMCGGMKTDGDTRPKQQLDTGKRIHPERASLLLQSTWSPITSIIALSLQ